MMFLFIKIYRLLTVGTVIERIVTCFLCCQATANDKNTIIAGKFEKCCYSGKYNIYCGGKHVFNIDKELILPSRKHVYINLTP